MTDYKMQMCRDIAKELGLSPSDVKYAHDLIFEHMKMLIANGENIVVKHFGLFERTPQGGVRFTKSKKWKLIKS